MNASTKTPTAGAAGSVPATAVAGTTPAGANAPGYPLNLKQIQGNILGGFNKDHQTFLFLRFGDKQSAREWVGGIAKEVASAAEVEAFDGLFKLVNGRRGGELGVVKATWMNIAFTHSGIEFLGANGADLFPDAFQKGMRKRADVIGDTGASALENWVTPLRNGEIHALMIVASDSQEDLGEHVLRYVHNMGVHGVQLIYLQDGAVRQDDPGHEHFGFRDGVSQPGVRHLDSHVPGLVAAAKPIQGNPGQDRLHAGEFVLGYPTQLPFAKTGCPGGKKVEPNPDEGPLSPKHKKSETEDAHETAPDWAVNGSYLVFRRLAQNVKGFRDMVDCLAKENKFGTTDPAVVGAKLVGRYKSGAPLELTKDEMLLFPKGLDTAAGDPSDAVAAALGIGPDPKSNDGNLAEDRRLNNHFEFGEDNGEIVPRAAHIRKAYPRDEAQQDGGDENDVQTHRIMRRGIPFGTSFRPGLGASGHGGQPGVEEPGDRGLLFLCYQSSLERQFEFIQQKWVHNADFPFAGDGEDPIIAQTPAGDFALQPKAGDKGKAAHVQITHFVTMTGGEYFFQPSIDVLTSELGDKPADEKPLVTTPEKDLGDIDQPGFDPCIGAE